MQPQFLTTARILSKFMTAAVVLVWILFPCVAAAQNRSQGTVAERLVRIRITKIFRETIDAGSGATDQGVRFHTRVPPSDEAIKEIRSFGDDALPVLDEYLWSINRRETDLAMRFMGALGGKRVIDPLRRVVEKHPVPEIRISALRWLSQIPDHPAKQVVRDAARNDPDQGVRTVAQTLLERHPPERKRK